MWLLVWMPISIMGVLIGVGTDSILGISIGAVIFGMGLWVGFCLWPFRGSTPTRHSNTGPE
jgi:hypothetical protein